MTRLQPWLRLRGPDLLIVALYVFWAIVDPMTN
jgi:hypothetical protein